MHTKSPMDVQKVVIRSIAGPRTTPPSLSLWTTASRSNRAGLSKMKVRCTMTKARCDRARPCCSRIRSRGRFRTTEHLRHFLIRRCGVVNRLDLVYSPRKSSRRPSPPRQQRKKIDPQKSMRPLMSATVLCHRSSMSSLNAVVASKKFTKRKTTRR